MGGTRGLEAPSLLLQPVAQQAGLSGSGCPGQAQAGGCPPATACAEPAGSRSCLGPATSKLRREHNDVRNAGLPGPCVRPGFPLK